MFALGSQHLDLDCGISHTRIESWLDDELELSHDDCGWVFALENQLCHIEVSPLESRMFGTIALERSRLKAMGDANALAAFERLFTLRFISAGG